MMSLPLPVARPGPWTEDGLTATTSTPVRRAGGERRLLALVLGAVVDRQVGAAVGGVLVRRPCPAASPTEARRGRVDHAADAGPGGGPYGGLGAADVDLQEHAPGRPGSGS